MIPGQLKMGEHQAKCGALIASDVLISIAHLNPAHVLDVNFNIFQLSLLNFKKIFCILYRQ